MTSVVNPQRCLATGIRTNRRKNKSQSAWINQKRNSAPSSIQAINPTLLRLAQFICGEAQRAQSVTPHDLDTATGGLAAHKLRSPQNGRHNAQYPTDRWTAWLKDRPIISPKFFKDRQLTYFGIRWTVFTCSPFLNLHSSAHPFL